MYFLTGFKQSFDIYDDILCSHTSPICKYHKYMGLTDHSLNFLFHYLNICSSGKSCALKCNNLDAHVDSVSY